MLGAFQLKPRQKGNPGHSTAGKKEDAKSL